MKKKMKAMKKMKKKKMNEEENEEENEESENEEENEKNSEESVSNASTEDEDEDEEVLEYLGARPMEYEEEEVEEAVLREYHYRGALESLAKGRFSSFLNDPFIAKEFPRADDELRIYCGKNNHTFISFFTQNI